MSIVSFLEQAIQFLCNRRSVGRQLKSTEVTPSAIGWILSDHDRQPISPLVVTQAQRARHLYLLGATGCGKTNLILQLLDQDLSVQRSIVIVDLRGDLIDRILLRLAAADDGHLAEKVILLDLRDPDRIVGFNPLAGSADPHSRAYLVLDALKAHAESWGIQLEETLRNSLIALAEARMTLLDLDPLLTDSPFRAKVLSSGSDPSVASFFRRYDELSPERQSAWFLPVLNKVSPLLGIPRLRLLFGAEQTVDLKAIVDRPGSILLVSLGVDRFHSAAKLVGSLIIGALEAAVMSRVDLPEASRNPVNLYIDEFETMATEAFSSIVAEGRRFRLSLTLSHQNLSQVSNNLRNCLRSNIATQFYFSTGSLDARELRHDLRLDEGDDVIGALQTLPVGHAYLNRRPADPVLVRINESKDPKTEKQAVAAFLSRVHQVGETQTARDVLEQISQRQQTKSALPVTPPEIHHKRLPGKRRGGEQ